MYFPVSDGHTETKAISTEKDIFYMHKKLNLPDVSSSALHILAMGLMLCDHLWATVLFQYRWLNLMGRVAYPIFAFLLVEGYFRTSNLKRHFKRVLITALITEPFFDLIYGGSPFYPYHQNVLWTFLMGMGGIWVIEKIRAKGKLWLTLPVSALVILLLALAAQIIGTDYYAAGIITIFIFYFFRGRKWWCYLGQFLALYWLNVEVLAGLCYIVTIFGHDFELVQQGFSLLALIPIWLYRGRKGIRDKRFQYFCYAFYPLHLFILSIPLFFL